MRFKAPSWGLWLPVLVHYGIRVLALQLLGAVLDLEWRTWYREQLEEMKRILPARGSVDLTRVSKIDAEQTAEPRRNSLPSRYVSLLDKEQRPSRVNYEVVLKAYMKMKRTKCRCEDQARGEEREIPEVNIIPSTPGVRLGCEVLEEILPQVAEDSPAQTQARSRAGGHQQRKRPQ